MQENRIIDTKRQLWKAAYARRDIQQVIEICGFLVAKHKETPGAIANALVTAIFVCYAKPFGNNNGVGILPKTLVTWDSADETALHEFLLHGRNKFFAHSDASEQYFENQIPVGAILQLTVIGKDIEPGELAVSTRVQEPLLNLEFIPRIKGLCETLMKRLKEQEAECLKSLHKMGVKFKAGENPINIP